MLLTIFILPLLILTGCSEKNSSVEDLAYVIAIGIDKGESNYLKLSLQFATPSSSGSGSSSGASSSSGSESTISTTECSTIDSGLNLINSYISDKINLSHCKVIVFSEELAADGIDNLVYTLVNNIQIRPDCSVIVSRCDAYDFLDNSKPVLVNLVERYYEVVVSSGDYTGYSTDVSLIDFYSNLKDSSIQPVAILGGINTQKSQNIGQNTNLIDLDSSYKAGDALIKHKNNIEIMGLAVFKEDKLIGELNGIETISHLLVTGKLKDCNINIVDPFNENSFISLSLNQSKAPKINVKMVNNSPFVTCDIFLEANILSLNRNSDYSNKENLDIISKYVDSYLENNIDKYLYKTSRDFRSDISGIGRKTLSQYIDLASWEKINWLGNYQNAVFNVNVHTTIKSSSLILKN